MKYYPDQVEADTAALDAFLKSLPICTLVTGSGAKIQHGMFNPLVKDRDPNQIELHLNRADQQIKDIAENPNVKLIFNEFLTMIPSYWVDANDGSFATMYYRYVEIDCQAQLVEDHAEFADLLNRLMHRYQPEGKFTPVDMAHELYTVMPKWIVGLRCEILKVTSKFKLGQNRDLPTRRRIIENLRARNGPGDARTAEILVDWLERHPVRD